MIYVYSEDRRNILQTAKSKDTLLDLVIEHSSSVPIELVTLQGNLALLERLENITLNGYDSISQTVFERTDMIVVACDSYCSNAQFVMTFERFRTAARSLPCLVCVGNYGCTEEFILHTLELTHWISNMPSVHTNMMKLINSVTQNECIWNSDLSTCNEIALAFYACHNNPKYRNAEKAAKGILHDITSGTPFRVAPRAGFGPCWTEECCWEKYQHKTKCNRSEVPASLRGRWATVVSTNFANCAFYSLTGEVIGLKDILQGNLSDLTSAPAEPTHMFT